MVSWSQCTHATSHRAEENKEKETNKKEQSLHKRDIPPETILQRKLTRRLSTAESIITWPRRRRENSTHLTKRIYKQIKSIFTPIEHPNEDVKLSVEIQAKYQSNISTRNMAKSMWIRQENV